MARDVKKTARQYFHAGIRIVSAEVLLSTSKLFAVLLVYNILDCRSSNSRTVSRFIKNNSIYGEYVAAVFMVIPMMIP